MPSVDTLQKFLNKKLKTFTHNNPIPIEYELTSSCVILRVAGTEPYVTAYEDFASIRTTEEESAYVFVEKLDEVLYERYPELVYKIFEVRQKTPEEMSVSLMKGDDTTTVYEESLQKRKRFKVVRARVKDSTFILEDVADKRRTVFQFNPATPFLLRLRSGENSAEELGKMFFRRARKVREI